MTINENHRRRHLKLHRDLDELIADFIDNTGRTLTGTNLMELIEWSSAQTQEPVGRWLSDDDHVPFPFPEGERKSEARTRSESDEYDRQTIHQS